MRQTEEAYRKGLVQGYALAKAQYEELLRAYQFRSDTDDLNKVQLNLVRNPLPLNEM